MNKKEFIEKLESFGLPKDGYMIRSGGSLLLRGLREQTADFDLCVSQKVAEMLDLEQYPQDETGSYVPFENVQMKTNLGEHPFEIVDGYPCETLESILALKRMLMRPKDIPDIAAIEQYLLEKLIENMIRWAESKLGSTEYAGWCLAFIEDALEISNHIEVFGGDSAKESCEMYKDALRGGVPERGAFVFYDCLCPSENGPVNWGHCGVSLGEGRVIHAWDMVRIDDYLAIEKLTALTGDHPEYLGWVALERVLDQKPRV